MKQENTTPIAAAQSPGVDPEVAVAVARRVTWVGFVCNALLGAAKVCGGIVGRSEALVADGFHSLSDFITDVIVLVMVGMARRKSSRRYPYGHGKVETFATMLLSVVLLVVALMIGYEGVCRVADCMRGDVIPRPGPVALALCGVSIVVKEWLFRYTRRAGRRINSGVVIANAWHHRSDAFSSVATLMGIMGAMFLGERWRVLDPVAAIIVAVFIAIIAVRMAIPAVRELLEVSLPGDMEESVRRVLATTPGVRAFHHLRSRRNGTAIIIDVHLKVDPFISVIDAHAIATRAEKAIYALFGERDTIVTTHIEPYEGEVRLPDGSCGD